MQKNNNFKFLNFFNTITLLLILLFVLIITFSILKDNKSYLHSSAKKLLSIVIPNSFNDKIDKDIVKLMQSGNNTIFIRHADDDKKNRDGAFDVASLHKKFEDTELLNTAPLSKKGHMQSLIILKFFDDFDISYDEVWTSPILRAKQTALYFANENEIKKPIWLYLESLSEIKDKEKKKQKLRDHFFTKTDGKNRIIVGHGGYTSLLGFNIDLNKSEFIVYNHELNKMILHGKIIEIAKYYFD